MSQVDRGLVSAEHRSPWIWLTVGLGFLVAAIAALLVDLTVARQLVAESLPGALREPLSVCCAFGNTWGIVFCAWGIYVLSPGDRRRLPRFLAAALGANVAADAIKLLVSRSRPYAFDLEQVVVQVSDTFQGWLPLLRGGARLHSFPSSHTAAAVGAAIALARFYPRARLLFVVLAIGAGLQRIAVGAHFTSDVLAGAGIGWLVAAACFEHRWLRQMFERWERRTPKSTGAPLRVVSPANSMSAAANAP